MPTKPGRDTRRIFRVSLATLVVLGLLGGGGYGAYRWSQSQFFVGSSSGSVAIFHGLPQDLGPVPLSSVASVAADVPVDDLPPYTRNQVKQGIVTDDETAAVGVVERLRVQAANCRAALATPTPSATPTPTSTPPSPSNSGKPKATPTKKASSDPASSNKNSSAGPTTAPVVAAAGSSASSTVIATPTTTTSATSTADSGTDGTVTSEDCRGLG